MGSWRLEDNYSAGARLPESPRVPMEFLSRSWSASALEVSKALAPHISSMFPRPATIATAAAAASSAPIPEHFSGEFEEHQSTLLSTNPLYSFASSATSQRVLDRIMSQSSQDVSPLTSGRPSLSSEPLNAGESCGGSLTATDSPPISPSQDFYDVVKFLRLNNPQQPQITGNRSAANPGGGGKTVGRWLKDRKEKKKEETRTQNAQLHAAVSVAGVAAAIAATAAATAASSRSGKDEKMAKTDMAVASAATLVAAQCVEAAEALGAERNHLASVISSAVNVRSYDDILTLTAAAATALRGAATLKARALKEGWTNCAVTPAAAERSTGPTNSSSDSHHSSNDSYGGEEVGFDQEFLSRGCELLKRTRKGDLHWKIVSVYIHRSGQVMLKMKSKHVAGTITKKKKNVVFEVYKDLPVWPGRLLLEDGEQHRYFGLKTEMRGIVEFECKNQKEHDKWTRGISTLLFASHITYQQL